MSRTLRVVWAEQAIRDAVERALAVLRASDCDRFEMPGGTWLTDLDLACLADAGRAFLPESETNDGGVSE